MVKTNFESFIILKSGSNLIKDLTDIFELDPFYYFEFSSKKTYNHLFTIKPQTLEYIIDETIFDKLTKICNESISNKPKKYEKIYKRICIPFDNKGLYISSVKYTSSLSIIKVLILNDCDSSKPYNIKKLTEESKKDIWNTINKIKGGRIKYMKEDKPIDITEFSNSVKEVIEKKYVKPKFRTLRVRYMVDENGKLPTYSTSGSAGCDLYASEDGEIKPNEISMVKTGLKVAIPKGFELQIRPRSGLALKKSITVLNSPGTIDSDYRGEIGIILANFGKEIFTFSKGDRIAQGVFAPYKVAEFIKSDNLDETERGEGGFGHSGVK